MPFEPKAILDIGAFTLRALQRWPDARVTCHEPMSFNTVHLRRNVPAGVTIMSAAVREKTGLGDIFVGDMFVTGGFVQFGRQTNQRMMVERVAAASLPSCELVKIDTEGREVEILKTPFCWLTPARLV